jgi:WD40 repeat protein
MIVKIAQQAGNYGLVRFSLDGKVLAAVNGHDCSLDVWDVATQKELFHFKGEQRTYGWFTFRRDSRVLAVNAPDPGVVFLDVPSGKELPKMPKAELVKIHPGPGGVTLLLSPDGKLVITSGNTSGTFGKAYVWERDTGRLVTEWQAHQSFAHLVSLSPNGKVLLTRGESIALVWDLDGLLKKEGSR